MRLVFTLSFVCLSAFVFSQPKILVNQVGFDAALPKTAVIVTREKSVANLKFDIVDVSSGKVVFSGPVNRPVSVPDWNMGDIFYAIDFSSCKKPGRYKISVGADQPVVSDEFVIDKNALAKLTIPSIAHYYRKQRADTKEELAADNHIKLFGSDKTADVRGGWCDASGDVSKYFSHLAYANFMSPQQTPLVAWSLVNTAEAIARELLQWQVKDSIEDEALYGADYMVRCFSPEDYFYMIVFSYFSKDPGARRIVGLHANSVTTSEYQCAFREGGGMAIAALARISKWKKHGVFTSQRYLEVAERAFAHLLVNNTKYDDDGKENIIDDYCALMAATELWIATGKNEYAGQARKRAQSLTSRITREGWFTSGNNNRPFWHASDAGLPVMALLRYLQKEEDATMRLQVERVMKRSLRYQLHLNQEVANPFGYARQTFSIGNKIKNGFFIPHENETGWWWQGENARLGSLAAAALEAAKLWSKNDRALSDSLRMFASQQVSWVLGCNPYSVCFLYGFGKNNVPYMRSNFGHGSERGGISNGITGKDGNADGSGISYKTEAAGNEWRWTEQWIPHSAWFLNAIVAMTE